MVREGLDPGSLLVLHLLSLLWTWEGSEPHCKAVGVCVLIGQPQNALPPDYWARVLHVSDPPGSLAAPVVHGWLKS